MKKKPKILKVYIGIIPCDYARAEAEVFASKEEAEDFIQEHAIRGDTHYCSVVESEVVLP